MWAEAFLAQARSDWQIYTKLKQANEPSCHILHYLQMATEKLGKAYLLAGKTAIDEVQTSHLAFTRFLRFISRNGKLQQELGMTARQMRLHVEHLLSIAHAIEKLAPALAGKGINSEYPWKVPNGKVVAPVRYNFSLSEQLDSPSGINLLKLVNIVLKKFWFLHDVRRKGA
jgi:hypothetical protein